MREAGTRKKVGVVVVTSLLVHLLVHFVLLTTPLKAAAQEGMESPNATREFVMSCTYGVIAGALVGTATLAFTQQPGDNLRNIARGASLGLYAGILMGLYVVYVLPGQGQEEELPPGISAPAEEGVRWTPPVVIPLISERGAVEGASLQLPALLF
jgi:hypothetical protein